MKQKIVMVLFLLLLLFVITEARAQGAKCRELGLSGYCIDIELSLWKEDLETRSDYNFSDIFSAGDYLVIEKITIVNNPETCYESKNTSNLSLQIYVNPLDSEKEEIARLDDIPPLKIGDTYEVTYCGQNRLYDFKLNNETIAKKKWSNINPKKLSVDGWWQIAVKLEPLTMYIDPTVGYTSFGYSTIINGEQENYNFKVYSDIEIAELKTERKNLIISVLGMVATILALVFGVSSFIIAWKSKHISEESDTKMKKLTDSQIDEKLAMFAEYLANTHATLKMMKRPYPRAVWALNEIRRVNSDFNAVSDLKKYASPSKKEALITDYIIPILKDLYSIKKMYQKDLNSLNLNDLMRYYPVYHIHPNDWKEWNDILTEITNTALNYDIKTEEIRNLTND